MTNKRRYTLIIVSVSIGTVLSAFMMASRSQLNGTDVVTLLFNMGLAVGIIVALAIFFRSMDKKEKEKENQQE